MSGLCASIAQSIAATTLRAYSISTSSHHSANSSGIPRLSICGLNSYKLAFYLSGVGAEYTLSPMQYQRGRAEDLGEHSLLDSRERFRLGSSYQRNAEIDMECTGCRFVGSWAFPFPFIPSPVDLRCNCSHQAQRGWYDPFLEFRRQQY
jgi:hypothetical protein